MKKPNNNSKLFIYWAKSERKRDTIIKLVY